MANYFVIDNTFRPYSFDEIIKPYQMYGQAYKEQEALLDVARDKEFSPENLDKDADKAAFDMYNAAANNLKVASDELATRGLSTKLRAQIRSTAKDYKRTMDNLNQAQERLFAEQERRAKQGPGYIYQQENLRIGDFLNGATPNQKGAKLSDVTSDIAAEFQSRAKGITQDTWNKVLNQNGKVINGYYDVKTEAGLKEAQLDTILQLANPEGWNRFVASNPTITEEQKRELSGFINSINSEMDAVGYGNYSTDGQKEIWNAIVKGAHAGLGSEEHKYQIDRSYNPELAYRMQRDKIADAEKAAQKRIDEGKDPFYTDPEGNKWYSDGNLVWEHDKDGKQIMTPTPKSKLMGNSEEDKAAAKAAEEERKAKAAGFAAAQKEFPLYFEAWNENRNRGLAKSGMDEFDEKDANVMPVTDFTEVQQRILQDQLTKYNLTPNDVIIYKDSDWWTNNHYKIALKPRNGSEPITIIGDINGNNMQINPSDTTINRSATAASGYPGF